MTLRAAFTAATTADLQLKALARAVPATAPLLEPITGNVALALGHIENVIDDAERRARAEAKRAASGAVTLELTGPEVDALARSLPPDATVVVQQCGCPDCRAAKAAGAMRCVIEVAKLRALRIDALAAACSAVTVPEPQPPKPGEAALGS